MPTLSSQGEGRLDGQTALGKAPIGVAHLARKRKHNESPRLCRIASLGRGYVTRTESMPSSQFYEESSPFKSDGKENARKYDSQRRTSISFNQSSSIGNYNVA